MKDRLLSIVSAIGGGVGTYETAGADIIITLTVAFVCGLLGLLGNELGRYIVKKIKNRKNASKK